MTLGLSEYMDFTSYMDDLIKTIQANTTGDSFIISYEEFLAGYSALDDLACVYILYNTLRKAAYVGSSSNLRKRLVEHFGKGRDGFKKSRNSNPPLQRAIGVDGKECFDIIVPEVIPYASNLTAQDLRRRLNARENYYLRVLYPTGRLYNISRRSNKRDVPADRFNNRTLYNTRYIPRK